MARSEFLLLIFHCFSISAWIQHSYSKICFNQGPLFATSSDTHSSASTSRRSYVQKNLASGLALLAPSIMLGVTPTKAGAEDLARRTSDAQITDTVYFVVKGLKDSSGNPINSKVEIGLFGKDAPQAVSQLKQLASPAGLPAPCRPKAQRSLQKEQLEANKVYASCMEGESDGVSLRYSQIWRVVPQQRIDVGAVAGKFVAGVDFARKKILLENIFSTGYCKMS